MPNMQPTRRPHPAHHSTPALPLSPCRQSQLLFLLLGPVRLCEPRR